tara:strand:- start:227 stop:1144 length:918 start_codon:yes stop_codon:yes gene_type:complete
VRFALYVFLSSLFYQGLFAQSDTNTVNRQRLNGLIVTGSVVYAGTMLGLNELWYKQYPRSSFHFFNDNLEWLQIDKAGHVHSAYFESVWSINSFKWAGISSKKSALLGAGVGFLYQSTIELLDGFSEKWGASSGDIISNAIGSAMAASQELAWQEQRIYVKYSFHPVSYSDDQLNERAKNLYGSSLTETFLKDYNGQTYWLSLNLAPFFKNAEFPDWLNLALGYSADGMFGGFKNQWVENGVEIIRDDIPRIRQYYLSLDINLAKLETKSRFIKTLLSLLNHVKVPFTALSFDSKNGLQLHPIYF